MSVLKSRSGAVFLLLLVACVLGSAQGSKVRSTSESIKKEDRDQPKARAEWFQRGRAIPGQRSASLRYRAYQQKLRMRAARPKAATIHPLAPPPTVPLVWKPLGPSPLASDASGTGQQDYNWVSGRATAVAIDRADPSGNTVYVGGAYGGLWKSTNAGPLNPDPASVVWTPLIDDQSTLAVGAIAIQPQLTSLDSSKSVVLVGTGEANSSTDSYYGLGILRSANAGSTWMLIAGDSSGTRSFAGLSFSKIAFSTANPKLAVAAVAGASQGLINGRANPPTANLGLYYSTDAGISWSYANVLDGISSITPSSATSVVYNQAAGLFFAAIRFHGFYSSSDGINWSRLNLQPGFGLGSAACPGSTSNACPIYRGEIAVVGGRNEVYVWYVDRSDNDQGIWKTTNGGASWNQISTTSIAACGDFLDGCGTENGSYNLTLAAIPDGTATNLYAGAVNLYKCRITSLSPACDGPDTFLNLTHVYGCTPNLGSIAHVHPAQHAIDVWVSGGKSLMYFANDGGIYRALDGYTGLTSGDCGNANQFDSLNQTLGSMTQFVSFAQHPSDANTLLGGAQGNGSPATAEALTNSGWSNVNSGDGGYSEINPADPSEWFTTNPGVNIERCTLGVSCHAQDFGNDPVVSSATLDGDGGPFYTPYILDPQNSGGMIVGTCRVWRGTALGFGFLPLSNNFDTGSAATCSGNEINLVRSLAAGGPTDSNGFSQVIYAGTDGFGPFAVTIPTAGHIWVTTQASDGPSAWADRTGSINPNHFPVSSIAIDISDGNGMRAYVTLVGFHSPRVWMTPSGGISWFDFTGNLPDAPVNSVLVDHGPDPLSGAIYVGTDVGVFVSGTQTPNWTEVGPASGISGFLPNVPVSALRIFDSGPTKLLRASTYGRGIWQFPLSTAPDFQVAFPNPSQTAFASQTTTFSGVLSRFNGYASPVNLSCTTGNTAPPAICNVAPASVTPSPSGTRFTVTSGGAIGDYSFKVRAAGTDPDTIAHEAALTLHVVDFDLTAPSPNNLRVNQGEISPPTVFQVNAQGTFQGMVSLSCTGLPAGAVCNFSPANIVAPRQGSPSDISLIISANSSTASGIFLLTVHAVTNGAPEKTQSLQVAIGTQDYTIAIANPSQSVAPNAAAVFNGMLTSNSGFTSMVNLSCGAGAPPTCTISPASLIPRPAGTAFSVTLQSNIAQTYNFNVVAQGTDAFTTSHTAAIAFTTIFDFSLTFDPPSRSVTAGQAATYNLTLDPLGGSFTSAVSLSCTGLPARTTCSFSPGQVAAGSPTTSSTLTITTSAPASASTHPAGYLSYGLWLPGLVLLSGAVSRRRRNWGAAILLLFLLAGLFACGGGLVGGGGGGGGGGNPNPGTAPGTYLITVNASGPVSHSVQVSLTVQ